MEDSWSAPRANQSYERLSAGTDAKVFAVSTDGSLWKYEGNNWTSTRAGGFSDVAVSQMGTVWVAGKDGTISFSNNDGASWTKTDASGFSNISVWVMTLRYGLPERTELCGATMAKPGRESLAVTWPTWLSVLRDERG